MQSDDNKHNNLKKLRKDKGLSIADVGRSLKLTTEVIQKLEHSDFKNFGAFTYIRGYINHYSSLLGVDPERYIELIPKSEIEVPLVNTSSTTTKGIKLKRQSKNIISYVIGTFLVVGISFSGWYLLSNYTNNKNIEIVKSNNLEILPKNENTGNAVINDVTEDAFHYSSLIPTKDESISESLDDNEIVIPPQNTILVSETSLKDNQTDVMAYKIIIEASETSWVKVEHLDGSKLHNDLLKPGSITIDANQAVHFRIGNEKNVKLSINGEEIDLSKYSNQDIADFNWPIES